MRNEYHDSVIICKDDAFIDEEANHFDSPKKFGVKNMLIRIAIALSSKEKGKGFTKKSTAEDNLAMKLAVISLIMKVEFDIACYSNDFDKLLKNLRDLDIIITDFDTLDENRTKIGGMYSANSKCLPILVGSSREKLCDYLMLRPIEHIGSIEDIDPENDKNKIKKVCELFLQIAKDGFLTKTDNSVLYITTRQDSYAIPKDSILYCQSDLKYTVFVTESGMLIRKLEKLQNVENKYLWDFMRVHQSFLVNPHKIKYVDKTTKEIILSNNARIPFSRRYYADICDLFNN